ncbi:hypothetical protein L6V77_35835, partial [Myxococcota bacterium]|nr:hypothetical protein [Myxococcota bacterium]
MRATSRKRWEPCFNADLGVTAGGIIVSQFLTKDTTDYHHFRPAVEFVRSNLGQPGRWIGDGHYSTEANIVLAHECGVELFAPRQRAPERPPASSPSVGVERAPTPRARGSDTHTRVDFVRDPEKNVLLCPAGEELRFMGEYPTDSG